MTIPRNLTQSSLDFGMTLRMQSTFPVLRIKSYGIVSIEVRFYLNFQDFLSQGPFCQLRRQHVLGGRTEGCPLVPMVQRSQYIRVKNPLHKHFAGMPMVGGQGSKIVKICRRLKWMVPNQMKQTYFFSTLTGYIEEGKRR